jgi:hypothetical protein
MTTSDHPPRSAKIGSNGAPPTTVNPPNSPAEPRLRTARRRGVRDIVPIGPPGSGKSTQGKLVASEFGLG